MKNIETVRDLLRDLVMTWPAGGGHTVGPSATADQIRAMTTAYGLDHLGESSDAICQFRTRGVEFEAYANLVGVNVGAGLNEALLCSLGAGSARVVLLDRPGAGKEVVGEVFERLALPDPEYVQIEDVEKLQALEGATLIFTSHGLNTNWRDAPRQEALERQNDIVLDALARLTDPSATVAFVSVEPGAARNNTAFMARPWAGNREICKSVRCAPANRTPGKYASKRAEYFLLGPEVATVSQAWVETRLRARRFVTCHGTRVVEFVPAPVTPVQRLIAGEIGPRITLSLDEADFAEALYDAYLGEVAHAERLERLEIFGDESDDFDFATIGGA